MIRQLASALGPAHRGAYLRYLTALAVYNILQGAAYVLLVPTLRDLLAGDTAAAAHWFAVLAAVTVASWLASYAHQQMGFEIGLQLSRILHRRLGDALADLPIGWFSGTRIGGIGQLASAGVIDLMGLPAHMFQPLVAAALTPLTVVAGMLFFDARLALITLATVPVVALVFSFAARLSSSTDDATHRAAVEAGDRIVEFTRLQPVLRAAGRAADGFDLLEADLRAQHAAGRRQLHRALPALGANALTVQLVFTGLLATGVALALADSARTPVLVALLVLLARFAEPLAATAELGGHLRAARNSLNRINAILATPPLAEPDTPATARGHLVSFDDVHFSYEPGQPVLEGVSFTLTPGSTTALVGASGAGKTTILSLLARFHDVDAGSIRIGGVDLRELGSQQLSALVAVVFQDVYLFEGTIADNIRLARPEATDSEFARASRAARVDEIVDRLPDGWNTQVGEGGTRLSGGERQRVSIARALLKGTPIVLLDEATAATDPENEAAIAAALAALAAERTLFVVAHRLSTITTADQILVLDGKRITEAGNHAQLLAADGAYTASWRAHEDAQGWRLTPSPEPGRATLPR